MAYIVGLTATDGCLVSTRPRIDFKSADRQLVETFVSVLGRTDRIAAAPTRAGGVVFGVQITDRNLYEWFRSVGLSPRKSLTIGSIDVPDQFLFPLTRGLLDGDGSIIFQLVRRQDYVYGYQIRASVCCYQSTRGRAGLEWLKQQLGCGYLRDRAGSMSDYTIVGWSAVQRYWNW